MAISSGVFSAFFSTDTVPFLKPSLSSSGFLACSPPSNLRMVRTVSCFARVSSKQQEKSEEKQQEEKERRPRGIMRPRRVTQEMADFVGSSEISRTQVLKLIWAYIKENNLQDPANKKIIICDEKLKKLFGGRDSIGFLEVAGLITPHFLK